MGTVQTIPQRFCPRFWSDLDGRSSACREIKRRYEALKQDVGADSVQKDSLVQRACFIATWLETQEIDASEGVSPLDLRAYVAGVNTLIGLLRTLGIDKAVSDVPSLHDYVEATK